MNLCHSFGKVVHHLSPHVFVLAWLRLLRVSRAESLVIADIAEDLHEVLHMTQNVSGIPVAHDGVLVLFFIIK